MTDGPFRISGWTAMIVIECNQCRQRIATPDVDRHAHTLILTGLVGTTCPGCGATYQLVCFSFNGEKILPHLLNFDIVSSMRPDRIPTGPRKVDVVS